MKVTTFKPLACNGGTYTYDALNRIVSETNPLDGTKTFHYDKDSRIVGVTDRGGVRTSYKLDGNGNIVESIDGEGHSSFFEYDSMNRLTKVTLRRIDKIHKVDEIQETLYTYDHRGLVKTEINAAGDGKALVYDGNGNLIRKTDEDGYVTEYEYSPVNLVSKASYANGKVATYLCLRCHQPPGRGDQLAGRQVRLHLQRPVCAGAEHPDHPRRAGVRPGVRHRLHQL